MLFINKYAFYQQNQQVCMGFIDLANYLLQSGFEFVLLSQFSTDPLEKAFAKLRQGCGGTYVLNAQQSYEKIAISKAKIALRHELDISSFAAAGHLCELCSNRISDTGLEVFESLSSLENNLAFDEVQALVYVSGYVTRKLESVDLPSDSTFFYYEKFGSFTQHLDRGGLNIPNDSSCQWCMFCYLLFPAVKENVFQHSLTNIFQYLSEYYIFNMEVFQCRTFANILLSKLCKVMTPQSCRELKQKFLKL